MQKSLSQRTLTASNELFDAKFLDMYHPFDQSPMCEQLRASNRTINCYAQEIMAAYVTYDPKHWRDLKANLKAKLRKLRADRAYLENDKSTGPMRLAYIRGALAGYNVVEPILAELAK